MNVSTQYIGSVSANVNDPLNNDIVIFQSFNDILQSGDKYEFLEKYRDESPEKEKKDNFPERFDKYDDHQRSVQSNGSSTNRSHPQTPSLSPEVSTATALLRTLSKYLATFLIDVS